MSLDNQENGYHMELDVRRVVTHEEERLVEVDKDGSRYLIRLWNALLTDQETIDLALATIKAGGVLQSIEADTVRMCRLLRLKERIEKMTLVVETKHTCTEVGNPQWAWVNRKTHPKEYEAVSIRPSEKLKKLLAGCSLPPLKAFQGNGGCTSMDSCQTQRDDAALIDIEIGDCTQTTATDKNWTTRSKSKKNKQRASKGHTNLDRRDP